jgi:hypothetical protein
MKQERIDINDSETKILLQIRKILKDIRYGYIQIIVQDSKPVQIDKVEKFRLDKQDAKEGGG